MMIFLKKTEISGFLRPYLVFSDFPDAGKMEFLKDFQGPVATCSCNRGLVRPICPHVGS